ncbi:MAG: hypothetical protein JNL62_09190 [Bryobacterales bacterium]|nr:hypothetical protein [Bryobacterales bacterium]
MGISQSNLALREAILCYVYDDNNNPVPIDYSAVVAKANNTDPFPVPNGTRSPYSTTSRRQPRTSISNSIVSMGGRE